jgi:hypothetical protein
MIYLTFKYRAGWTFELLNDAVQIAGYSESELDGE